MVQAAEAPEGAAFQLDTSWVYFNGELTRYGDAKLGLLTHALHYGTGVFEGIRAYWNADRKQLYTVRMTDHYQRLHDNAHALQMRRAVDVDELCDVTNQLLQRNGFRQDAYVRPILFKSAEAIGVKIHDVEDSLGIVTLPLGDYIGTQGIRCLTSSWRRIDDTMAPVRTKCTGLYINAALAKSEALEGGFDEAIMLTHDGHVSEGSGENLFVVRRGVISTPASSDNILEGITRDCVMHLAREEMGLDVVERSIDRSELYLADEVFMVGTAAQVAPVVEVDRRRVGDGEPGPVTMRLQTMYLGAVTGRNPKYAEWLTPVY
jgi:branched-chain amino acid aminotransferase